MTTFDVTTESIETEPFVLLDIDNDESRTTIVGADIAYAMSRFDIYDDEYPEELRFRFYAIWNGGVYADLWPMVIDASELIHEARNQHVALGGAVDVLNLSNGRDPQSNDPYTLTDFHRAVQVHAHSLTTDDPDDLAHNLTAYGFEV